MHTLERGCVVRVTTTHVYGPNHKALSFTKIVGDREVDVNKTFARYINAPLDLHGGVSVKSATNMNMGQWLVWSLAYDKYGDGNALKYQAGD